MVRASREFLIRLKLNDEPIYRVCQLAGVNASTLSRLINRIDSIKPSDPRIIAVGKVLGLPPSDCFEKPEGQREVVVHEK